MKKLLNFVRLEKSIFSEEYEKVIKHSEDKGYARKRLEPPYDPNLRRYFLAD